MIGHRTFQVVQGIWNPAEQNHSWVVYDEFKTIKEARKELDRIIGNGRNAGIASREAYAGPPLALIQIDSKVLERIGIKAPEQDEVA